MQRILVIQTAFIGDVILATALLEKLHETFPATDLDILVRKGNESLLEAHPFVRKVLVWNKKQQKNKNLWRIIRQVRSEKYDLVVNLQRFFSTGLITVLSNAHTKVGFKKNPLSWLFDIKKTHQIGDGTHEVQRNMALLEAWTDTSLTKPKLYPSSAAYRKIQQLTASVKKYICIAPTSVWFTKQVPPAKWLELIYRIPPNTTIYLLGGPSDVESCNHILAQSQHPNIVNLAGKLRFLESAVLMEGAMMNYVNDSAPLHICSAMNAPVTAFFCSTVPAFGFTPLSDDATIVEAPHTLDCRPCGLHGYKACPKGHFRCADMDMKKIPV